MPFSHRDLSALSAPRSATDGEGGWRGDVHVDVDVDVPSVGAVLRFGDHRLPDAIEWMRNWAVLLALVLW